MIPGIIAQRRGGEFVPPGSSSEVLWTPAEITTALWLDAPDAANRTIVSGAVSQANDKSGNGIHHTQDAAGARPALIAAELNGLDIFSFDGTNDCLINNASGGLNLFRNKSYGWVFIVYKKRGTDGAAVNRSVFASTNDIGASRFLCQIGSTAFANRPQIQARRLDADSGASLNATGAVSGAWTMALYRVIWADGDGFIDLDGENDVTNLTYRTEGATSDTASGRALTLGAYATVADGTAADFFADMDFAELVVGNASAPDAGLIDRLFGYAAHRFALTAALPGGHPYLSAPPTV